MRFNSKYLTEDENGDFDLSPEAIEAIDKYMEQIQNIPLPDIPLQEDSINV